MLSISADVAALRRSLKKVEGAIATSSNEIQKQFDNAGKGIDRSITTSMQSRINAMVGIGTKSAKEWNGVLAGQGAELEKLRAKYNPVFAAINEYKASVVSIQQAHRVGAISADEMTSAIQRERRATLESISAIKQRNSAVLSARRSPALGGSNFNTSNIAAQFQDIAVTSAMGMSPVQIALQQGTQLSAVFNQMGKGREVIAGIGAAFASIVNPVSLVTIGVVAAGAALYQYIATGKKTKDLTVLFQQHAESIALVKQQYGDFGNLIQSFRTEDAASQIRALKDQLSEFYQVAGEEASRVASFGPGLLTELAPSFKDFPAAARDMQHAFSDLNASIRQGKPDLLAFREAMSKIANDTSIPQNIRDEAKAISELDDASVKAARAIPGVNAALGLLGDIASEQVGKINAVKKALEELAGIAVPALGDSERAYKAYDEAVRNDGSMENRIKAANELQKALGRIRASQMPVPGEKPNRESIAPEKPKSTRTKLTDAEKEKKAIDDVIASLKFEQEQLARSAVVQRVYNELKRAGVDINSKAGQEIAALATRNAELEESQKKLNKAQQDFNDGIDQLSSDALDAMGNVIAGTEDAADAFKKLAIEIVKSALTGKGAYSDFFASLSNSGMLGIFGSLFGGGGSAFSNSGQLAKSFASGGGMYANGTGFAKGGLSLVGERGPELIKLPGGSQVLPNVPSMKSLAAANANRSNVHVTVGVDVDKSGNLMPFVVSVSDRQASAAVAQNNVKALPTLVNQYAGKRQR
ncbi:phage tail length tape measure family protein [Phyllobacterium phragmitis]|uniref:phage tail length tape measure family protein n=1 Tax=Phyllobacterium phragmitis TaxID=2670329 RepID=UPI0013049843|nr:phage tail length tape measure family protein [Phyllobacterium phragmitis]